MGTGFDDGGDARGRLLNFCNDALDSIVDGKELLRAPGFGSSSVSAGSSSELPKLLMLADNSELGCDEKQFL